MNSTLKTHIAEAMDAFSRIQKKLATFLIENWNEIPMMSIEHISHETGVSTATITRFARKFEFNGFYDFKETIKNEVMESINPVDQFKLLKGDFSGKKSIVKVAKQDVKNINKLISSIKEETFTDIIRFVKNAKRIYTFGTSISSIFSNLIRYTFNQIQLETYCLDDGNISVEEKLVTLKKDDLVIFISFYPYSKSTIEFAQLAKEMGLKVISISDNEYSPISKYSDLVIPIPRENILFTTSVAAISVLINSIATEIAVKRKDELSEAIDNSDKILKRFYFLN